MQQHALPEASFEHKPQVMIAVQGPNAIKRVLEVEAVSVWGACAVLCYATRRLVIGRTGYTGEDGVEIMLPAEQAWSYGADCMKQVLLQLGLVRGTRCAWKQVKFVWAGSRRRDVAACQQHRLDHCLGARRPRVHRAQALSADRQSNN